MNNLRCEATKRREAKPMLVVGVGPLIAVLWKFDGEESGWVYRIQIIRKSEEKDHWKNLFRLSDLGHPLHLIQLLGTEVLFDGCLTQTDRQTSKILVSQVSWNSHEHQ